MLKAVSKLLSAHGKVLTVSLGSHYANLTEFYPKGYVTGGAVCPTDTAEDSMGPVNLKF